MKKIVLASLVCLGLGSSLMAQTGEQLAQNCKSCHGGNFSKSALGHSDDISRFSYGHLVGELSEFQEENENNKYFQIMRAQIKNFSSADIRKVSKYISNYSNTKNYKNENNDHDNDD